MDADWDEIARFTLPPPAVHAISTPASAVTFDDSQELLWIGNDHVSRTVAPHLMVLIINREE